MTTSLPVLSWPSTCTTIRSRSLLSSSVCWVSARPSSHGRARVLERGQRGGAGAAVVPGDQHHVGVRLGDARRDRADADLGDQLDVHPGGRVGVLQVVDELRQVLDRVDVVVRRRRDQADAGRGVPGLRDPRVHLVPGQLAALARLGALRHLDLQVIGVDEVLARHAEPAGGHLLDGGAAQVAVGVGAEPLGVLAALAGVGPAAEPVHRDGEGLVRLGGDRPVGHRPGGEPPHDRRDRLHLVNGDRRGSGRSARSSIPLMRSRPRSVLSCADWSSTSEVYSLKIS